MNTKKRIILQPEYVNKFVCDGLICEDNCCQGRWRIFVDEEHFKKIKKVTEPHLKQRIDKYIRRNRSNPDSSTYGRIHQDEELNQCIFLTDDKLCEIQMNLGTDYLWNVCWIYPRYTNLIDGKHERSLTMSCPLAAKEALLNREVMAFEQITEEGEELREIPKYNSLDTEGHLLLNKPPRYFWDIRIFVISLLQNRDYSLGDRLIILGLIYRNIEELFANKQGTGLPALLEQMTGLIESGFFHEELNKITPNLEVQVQMTKAMLDRRYIIGIQNQSRRYEECFTETLVGLGYTEDAKLEDIMKNYEYNYREYFLPYIAEREYILENYLVNEVFKEMMPFGNYKTIWDSYIFLCVLYSMTKLHLIGLAGFHKGLNDEITLKLIQSLSKVVIHNQGYIREAVEVIKESGYDSLAYMSILLKN